ncbi:5-formyltetrahydrofolate cyclo-ligase [hydrothermal vent metagenome]|uniref:5-formyltetrahydrofolate cyclo-ligase n=1 Tax=hydrothermal vent metagenome TaxID=652676 RepID=A0A3B0US74_9ZZZZ
MKFDKTLRNQLQQLRYRLSSPEKLQLNRIICDNIALHPVFQSSTNIATYHSINSEVNLETLNKHNKNFFLPVVKEQHTMTFNYYRTKQKLTKNKFGILEPVNNEIINQQDIHLCLVPLVGFNRKGDRLGMGGGYYDRYFKLNKFHQKPTILAGVAYDFQENGTITAQTWDIPLDIIFTNNEVIIP